MTVICDIISSMTQVKLFLSLLLLHAFADFLLQGMLVNIKSKHWWMDSTKKIVWGAQDTQYRHVRHDYYVGLFFHAFVWAMVTFAPILLQCSDAAAALIVFCNVIVHGFVEEYHVNRFRINMWQSQLLYLSQIALTFTLWMFIK